MKSIQLFYGGYNHSVCVWKELTLRVSSDYDECESSDHGSGQISCCNACTENSAPPSPHLRLQKRQIHLSVLPDRSIFMPFHIQWGYWRFGWRQHTLTYLLTQWSRVLLEKLTSKLAKKFPAFMEPESPSPYPQVAATCPSPEPTPSSPHDPLQLPEDPS